MLFLVMQRNLVLVLLVIIMDSQKEKLYKDVIRVLGSIELVIDDKDKFNIIRKELLDIANGIKRLGD